MRAASLAALVALTACGQAPEPPADVAENVAEAPAVRPEAVTLDAADGVKVRGIYTEARGERRALVLLFHQAGSSSGEYLPDIATRLSEAGYASLAIDQRSGGEMYGSNQTVAALGKSTSYTDAKKDLEVALVWAQAKGLPVVLWGSSYSASLALILAAEHAATVKAVLAFSPGEYFDGAPAVKPAAEKLTMPVFITSAQDAGEIAAAKTLFDAVPAESKVQFVPARGGVHGASILRTDRNPRGAEDAWVAVLDFLRRAAP